MQALEKPWPSGLPCSLPSTSSAWAGPCPWVGSRIFTFLVQMLATSAIVKSRALWSQGLGSRPSPIVITYRIIFMAAVGMSSTYVTGTW